MKKIKFKKIVCTHVQKPFPLKLALKPEGSSLADAAALLFPLKKKFIVHSKKLVIDLAPREPFGCEPAALLDFFFQEQGGRLESVTQELKKAFDLQELLISGIPKEKMFEAEGIRFVKSLSGVPAYKRLGMLDLFRLFQLVRKGQCENGVLISLYLGAEDIHTLYVPAEKSLEEVFKAVPELKIRFSKELFLTNPLSGEVFKPEHRVSSPSMDHLVFPGLLLTASGSLLFPFPQFNRKVRLAAGEPEAGTVQPCSNCRACADYCPSDLLPTFLYHNLKKGGEEETGKLNIAGCIQCGICTFVCPSRLPLSRKITEYIKENAEFLVEG